MKKTFAQKVIIGLSLLTGSIIAIFTIQSFMAVTAEHSAYREVERIAFKKIEMGCRYDMRCKDTEPQLYKDFDFHIISRPIKIYSENPNSFAKELTPTHILFITKISYGPTPNGEYGYILLEPTKVKRDSKYRHFKYRMSEYSLSAGTGYNLTREKLRIEPAYIDPEYFVGPAYRFFEIDVEDKKYDLFTGQNVRYAKDNRKTYIGGQMEWYSEDPYIYTRLEGIV